MLMEIAAAALGYLFSYSILSFDDTISDYTRFVMGSAMAGSWGFTAHLVSLNA